MAFLTATSFNDVVNGATEEFGPTNYQQIAQNKQDYPMFQRWFKKGKINLHGGIATRRQVMNRLPDAAGHVGWMDPDSANIYDLSDTIRVEWVHAVKSWAMFLQEALMMAGPEEIFDAVKMQREGAAIALIEELEAKAWSAPTTSSDTANPWGIPYWIVKNATTGFNGGAPSGHTTVGSVSLTDSPTFKNYTFQYTAVDKVSLLPALRLAMMKCRFRSPIPGSDYSKSAGRYCMYVNSDTMVSLETVGEAQNENLGRDLAPPKFGAGMLLLRGFDIVWAPELDSDSTSPVYGIDHSTVEVQGLRGDWFRDTKKPASDQHNVFEHYTDVTYNYLWTDRRRNFVGYI
jgi:hypothetical protein